jgi:hypothetical protein
LKFDIWNDYGEGVVAAAATCNLTAVPIAVTNLTTSASGSGTITATVSVTSSHDMAGITNTAASGSLTTAGPGGTVRIVVYGVNFGKIWLTAL